MTTKELLEQAEKAIDDVEISRFYDAQQAHALKSIAASLLVIAKELNRGGAPPQPPKEAKDE